MSAPEPLIIEDLPPKQREMAEVIGLDNFVALTKRFGGDDPYIPKYSELIKPSRNNEIRARFNGYNYSELAAMYDLTERYIRALVTDIAREARAKPMDGQLSFE